MPWCPECKTEYEEGVAVCADCQVGLVENLEDAVHWNEIIKTKLKQDAEDILAYLTYSGIEKVAVEETTVNEQSGYVVKVSKPEIKEAIKYLKPYLAEKMSENEEQEEYVINEYETENLDSESVVSELKSTVFTFGLMGVGLIIFSILAILDIIPINFSNPYLFAGIMTVVGVVFIFVAFHSHKKMNVTQSTMSSTKRDVATLVLWFKDRYTADSFLQMLHLDIEEVDEGAKYFVLMDAIKEVVSKQFTDYDSKIINSSAEIIYDEMF